ncbi:MAG TPA: LacI family DNA-binding transcriptional regulator [Opitutaceae bacterium]
MAGINQQLIAERLNLSRTTVSRCLSNHPAISAETRSKVMQFARELGYTNTPTRIVRRPRQSKPITIGVLIGVPAANVTLATFPFVLKGIRDRADVEHVAVDVHYQDPATFDPDAKRNPFFRQIRTGGWRGVILIYPFSEEAVRLIANKISAVAVLEDYAEAGLDSVDVDEAAGITHLVAHLVARGHRRIGFAAWHYPVGGHWALRRFGGYMEGIFEAGLEFRPEWVLNIHQRAPLFDHPGGIAREIARLVRHDRVTAWVCAADHQAYPLINHLHRLGIEVPRDCSVTGFDGVEPPAGLPQLTSMRVAHEDLGSSAVSRLTNRILHPDAPRRRILVEASLVAGETVAPPRAECR